MVMITLGFLASVFAWSAIVSLGPGGDEHPIPVVNVEMDKNVNPFENLPGDIIYLIFQELDVSIQQYAISNPISPWPQRRNLELDNRNVRNLSSTCKRLRLWAEPILFRQIVFEDSDELFDLYYDKVMIKLDQMLQKGSLKDLTK
jgi:hypothetical protein